VCVCVGGEFKLHFTHLFPSSQIKGDYTHDRGQYVQVLAMNSVLSK
jgi:hypothetical protein